MLPDYIGSDLDHDTLMGHGPEPEHAPEILVYVDGPIKRDPEVCVNWDEAMAVLERFDWHEWQTLVHVGMWDIEIYLCKRHTPKELAELAEQPPLMARLLSSLRQGA